MMVLDEAIRRKAVPPSVSYACAALDSVSLACLLSVKEYYSHGWLDSSQMIDEGSRRR